MKNRSTPQADGEPYDLVIVGSGAAGLTAGIIAARRGLKPVIIEKASTWGGTSALSMGGVWVPANQLMIKAGRKDSKGAAIKFLAETVPPDSLAATPERQAAFVESASSMMDELIDAGMQWDAEANHPDYNSEAPHANVGRCLDSRIFDGKKLGPWLRTMRRNSVFPFAVQLADLALMGKGKVGRMVRVGLRHYARKMLGQVPLGAGESLVAQLMYILQQYDVPVRLNTALEDICLESGRAVGVIVRTSQGSERIDARAGVILCSGGFAHNPGLRQRMHNLSGALSAAIPEDTGDAVSIAEKIGAMTELSDDAWWSSAFALPDGRPSVSHVERSVPFGLCVTSEGRRFVNESWDYYHFARAMVRRGGEPVWLIFDSRHRKRYPFQGALPGKTPRWMLDSGFLKIAGSLTELAAKCGIDAANLTETIARFNGFAQTGVDAEFHRGESRYDRYWGDPAQKPNPNLGSLEQAPFYAAQIHVGDLGTKGGFITDACGQVLSLAGKPIERLYASGNVTAPVVGKSYPGPGITLGPAMTFSYLAVEHVAKRVSNG